MEPAIQLVTQLGSFGLLCYIIFWTTKSGGPKLFESMANIRSSIDRNTHRLESLEASQVIHNEVTIKLIDKFMNGLSKADADALRQEIERARSSKAGLRPSQEGRPGS